MSYALFRLLGFIFLAWAMAIYQSGAQTDDQTMRAVKAMQRAAESYPTVRMYKKNAERYFFSRSPIDKSDLVYLSPLAAVIDRRISTKKFKNLVWKRDSLVIDPDVTYAYTEQLWLVSLNFTYTF